MKKKVTKSISKVTKKMTIEDLALMMNNKFIIIEDEIKTTKDQVSGLINYVETRFNKLESDMTDVKRELKGMRTEISLLSEKLDTRTSNTANPDNLRQLKMEIDTCNTKINQLGKIEVNMKSGYYDEEIQKLKHQVGQLTIRVDQFAAA